MATEDVLSCQTFNFIVEDYHSIRSYIENVFDDGDFDEADSENKSSNAEDSCSEKANSESRDVELTSDSAPSDIRKDNAFQGITLTNSINKDDVDPVLTNVCQLSNDIHSSKGDKIKFSLKTVKPVTLKQPHMSLEDPETSKSKPILPNQTIQAKENVITSYNHFKENKEKNKSSIFSGDEYEKSSDCSNSEKITLSSEQYISKSKHNNSKSIARSKVHKPKSPSPKQFMDKYRDGYSKRRKLSYSKRRKWKSPDGWASRKDLLRMRSCSSRSSEGDRIIAAQFSQPLQRRNRTESLEIENKKSKEDLNTIGIQTNCNKHHEENSSSNRQETDRSHPISSNSEKLLHKNSLDKSLHVTTSSSNERADKTTDRPIHEGSSSETENRCHPPKQGTIIEKDIDSDSSFNLWDIDPLLLNCIPTDEDILINHEKAKELIKSSPKVKVTVSDELRESDMEISDKQEKKDVCWSNNGSLRVNVMLLENAIKSLGSFEDVSLCCNLLLKHLQMLLINSTSHDSKLKIFANKLQELLETNFGKEGYFTLLKQHSHNSSLEHRVSGCFESSKTSHFQSMVDVSTEELSTPRAVSIENENAVSVSKCRKRVSIIAPVSGDIESDVKSGDLQVIERQIKAVLNPSILNNDISKVEYEEIVKMVVSQLGQRRKTPFQFDCITFLQRSLQMVKRRRLS